MGVPELRWDKGGTVDAEAFSFYGNGNENHQLGGRFFYTAE
jgi:hypothetical protein